MIDLLLFLSCLVHVALGIDTLRELARNNSVAGDNAGQYTQLLLPTVNGEKRPLLLFHQAGSDAHGWPNALLLRECRNATRPVSGVNSDTENAIDTNTNSAVCAHGPTRVLARGSSAAPCGRFLKAVLHRNRPLACFACGADTVVLACDDAQCRSHSMRPVLRSAVDGGHASYCDVVSLTPGHTASRPAVAQPYAIAVLVHRYSTAQNTSALLSVLCTNVSCDSAAGRRRTLVVDDAHHDSGTYPFALVTQWGLFASFFAERHLRVAQLSLADGNAQWTRHATIDASSTFRYDALALDQNTGRPVVMYVDEKSGIVNVASCAAWPCDHPSLFKIQPTKKKKKKISKK